MDRKYNRVLLKLSGEILAGDAHFGLDYEKELSGDMRRDSRGRKGRCRHLDGSRWQKHHSRRADNQVKAQADYMEYWRNH